MKSEELIKLLEELANLDLSDDYLIDDHPCSIAIERIKELEKAMQEFIDMMDNPETCDIPECYIDNHYFKFKELLK